MGFWFRGEAVGVAPIAAGKTADHDIGDGLYLTDNRTAALQYSELRTNDPAARRVYSININEAAIRTLDLTADPRWAKDLPLVEPSIKAANVNYGRVFANFVKANRINLSDYDAVIGVDYMRGGRQMCVLFKNGQPSRLQTVLRSGLTPEPIGGPPLDSTSIARRMPGGSSGFGEGMTIIGYGLVELALVFIGQKLQEGADDRWLKARMTEIEPTIRDEIGKHGAAIADLQVKGRRAFANITIEIERTTETATAIGAIDTFPVVHLKGVFVTGNEVNLDQGKRTEYYPGATNTYYQYTYSVEVSVSADERNLYKALMLEYQFYDRQASLDLGNRAWVTGRDAMRKAIIATFGEDAGYDFLDSGTWPKFTYQGKPFTK